MRVVSTRLTRGAESCGKVLQYADNPIEGAVNGEIYQVPHNNMDHEVRLCRDCARATDGAQLLAIIEKRTAA